MFDVLQQHFEKYSWVKFAFLFGSQARGDATQSSDWDIAIWLDNDIAPLERLAKIEDLRNALAKLLGKNDTAIDIVELNRAELSIAATVVNEGIVIKGEHSLELANYYVRIWALEEDFQWRLNNEPRTLPTANT